MIEVIVAEDHNIVRSGVRMLLETDPAIHIAAEASNGQDVLAHVARGEKIDVVLTDINMPELDGISLIKELQVLSPHTKVIILSMLDAEKYVIQSFLAGARGYLLKSVRADELIFSLKHVHAGNRYLCSELSIIMIDRLISSGHPPISDTTSNIDFSSREIEVLQLIAEGLTNNEMSDKLFISKRTVEGHRQSLIEKTGSRNTAMLIRFAVLNGIVR